MSRSLYSIHAKLAEMESKRRSSFWRLMTPGEERAWAVIQKRRANWNRTKAVWYIPRPSLPKPPTPHVPRRA